jgi:hypothetical protein
MSIGVSCWRAWELSAGVEPGTNTRASITAASEGAAVAADVPSGDVTDGSASELNPAMRRLPDNEAYISLISPSSGATVVTMTFYSGSP